MTALRGGAQSMILLSMVAPAVAGYVFTSFRGNGDGLHLATSRDAQHWQDTSPVFLRPEVGSRLLRDPHILRGPDGRYRMVWTTGWNDKGIGYATSRDLVHWSEQRYLPLMENVAGTRTCWAPETFYDRKNGRYLITWSSSVDGRFPETESKDRMNHRTYVVETKDFESFTEPRVLIDPGFDHIDTTILERNGQFIAVFKEGDKQGKKEWGPIHWAVADAPTGPFQIQPKSLITDRAEGPALTQIGERTLMYVDFYANGRYGLYETTDWATWIDRSSVMETVEGQRHGTVLAVDKGTLSAIAKAQAAAMKTVPKPALQGFTADPAIRRFGDRYYLYPTSDKPRWQTTDFSVWSSKDLRQWKKERMVLDVTKELKWANIEAWAPDCIERNGKYYFYFCAQGQVGVAVGDRPTGPFRDALGRPLVAKGQAKTYPIDPYPFIDDNGQAYLYLGNGTPTVYKLKPDMITLDGEPTYFPIKDFREGLCVFKRNGLYYFMWSEDDARSDDYRVAYGTSKSPFGPVEVPKEKIVLKKSGLVKGTGHHSVVQIPGTDRWVVAFHRHAIPGGGGYKRETCLSEMRFGPNGEILPIDPMKPFALK
ncbi:glycosyl hydrolase family 43 [bacterium]|nr:MAG: glycosyl hydrolase family 43 [bacterium]